MSSRNVSDDCAEQAQSIMAYVTESLVNLLKSVNELKEPFARIVDYMTRYFQSGFWKGGRMNGCRMSAGKSTIHYQANTEE